jgi:Zn-dependent protease
MYEVSLTSVQKFAAAALPILFAITLHEAAHAWAAKKFGDPTADRLGRLSLNPLKHIDPLGTLLIPALTYFLSGFVFGWAKPVPITWENLRHPKRDMVLVAAAGPVSNLVMAFGWALVARMALSLPETLAWVASPLLVMGVYGIFINALFAVFNFLPLPPLDGGRVAVGLLPGPAAYQLSRLEPYGVFIVLFLFMIGALSVVVGTPVRAITSFVGALFGIPV